MQLPLSVMIAFSFGFIDKVIPLHGQFRDINIAIADRFVKSL